jgi:hypothetical protein
MYYTSILGPKSSGDVVGTTFILQGIVVESVMPNTGDEVASSDITLILFFVENL